MSQQDNALLCQRCTHPSKIHRDPGYDTSCDYNNLELGYCRCPSFTGIWE